MGYQSIVVLTGAGISAESGIRTFRASDGLWEDHRVEDVATPEGFAVNPALVQNFYNQRRQQLLSESIKPNAAHLALADFEAHFNGEFLLVTQNIDNLHERAGSQHLLHMHGELLKSRCIATGRIREQADDIQVDSRCECCQQPGYLRPHVVWFNEMPLHLDEIYQALSRCDLFIAIGTSGNVYPAAGFFHEAKSHGATTVELNLEASLSSAQFDVQRQGLATEIVPTFFNEI
ncbi:Sir2 family NAD+-dependent deacetylase [Spartinivicinus ruber]|uniref:Sir2 family NAD+-dependent deacetylase n=1 Tax=Spartinivicinus ruber TaxID=2683272 RepID=UPI0013D1A690|nr:Sir2 family NAD+-dependent deacetylase [Spartinivicinus ruber]